MWLGQPSNHRLVALILELHIFGFLQPGLAVRSYQTQVTEIRRVM